jgi:N-acyl amino acid synthase of PEP-CTERM/exosortase system
VQEIPDHANAHIFRNFCGNSRSHVPSEIFRLRYDVYCSERSFLHPGDFPEGIELDAFDNCSRHFAAYTLDELLVGTVRLVQPSAIRSFPFELHCTTFADFKMPPRSECGEISRLVVKRTHRRRRADNVVGIPGFAIRDASVVPGPKPDLEPRHERSPMLLLGMYREIFRYSRSHGVRFWFAAMERSLARSLSKVGFQFEPIGPVAEYYGSVTPYIFDLDMLLEICVQNNAALGAWFKEEPTVLHGNR